MLLQISLPSTLNRLVLEWHIAGEQKLKMLLMLESLAWTRRNLKAYCITVRVFAQLVENSSAKQGKNFAC